MTDKSSHSSSSKKSGESIKDKRAKRKAKADGTAQMTRLTDPGRS
jgi:ribosomal protein S8E